MKEVYIFCLKNPITNEIKYIGKTTNLKRRLSQHIQDAKLKKVKRKVINWINSLLNKKLKPKIEIVEICTKQNWQDREIYWIKYYRDKYDLCNHHDGGLGCLGRKLADLEKERIKEIGYKNSFFSEEEKEIIWGMIKDNISYSEIIKTYPKFSHSSYRGIKVGGIWKHITGLKKPIRTNNKGTNNHKSRKVQCNNTGKIWDSARLAWLELYSNNYSYSYSYFRCMLSGHNINKTTLSYV